MINYDLKRIKAIIFDVDGVLSAETVMMDSQGEPMRSANIKDGYAIRLAQQKGVRIVILSGARTENIRKRYESLGVEDIFLGCKVKLQTYEQFLRTYALTDEEVLFMGDDIPDYEVLKRCGCPCCPADACPEVKEASIYVSRRNGGEGCCRDVIEQVLRTQGKWMSDAEAFGW